MSDLSIPPVALSRCSSDCGLQTLQAMAAGAEVGGALGQPWSLAFMSPPTSLPGACLLQRVFLQALQWVSMSLKEVASEQVATAWRKLEFSSG